MNLLERSFIVSSDSQDISYDAVAGSCIQKCCENTVAL